MIPWMLACRHEPRCEAPPSPDPGLGPGLSVSVDPLAARRDLVAHASPPRAEVWWEVDHADADLAGLRVPAHRLEPGQTWTVHARLGEDEVQASAVVPAPLETDVLVVVLDDLGVDEVAAYGLNDDAVPTPTLSALAAEGVRFDQAWATPMCTPTRGALLTGRYPRRTGLGWTADAGDGDDELPLDSVTLPEALRHADRTWSTSAVGKWHVAGPDSADPLRHPLDQGFDWYAGTIGNPSYAPGWGYQQWMKDDNGQLRVTAGYLTTDTADDAIARVQAMAEPWFLYVAFNAVHTPLSAPPPELASTPADPTLSELHDAMLQALDVELGRLLAAVDRSRTTVIVVGDNGTDDYAIEPPLDARQGKGSAHELGVRVPLLVTGPPVAEPGRVSHALVHVVDLLPTVADLAGVPITGDEGALALDLDRPIPLDGRSILANLEDADAPGRAVMYTEAFFPNGPGPDYEIDRRAIRDERYKLVTSNLGDALYDASDPDRLNDAPNLLDHPTRALRDVQRRLEDHLACLDLEYEGF